MRRAVCQQQLSFLSVTQLHILSLVWCQITLYNFSRKLAENSCSRISAGKNWLVEPVRLKLSSSRAAWHIGQQRVVSSVTGRQQQLHIPPPQPKKISQGEFLMKRNSAEGSTSCCQRDANSLGYR